MIQEITKNKFNIFNHSEFVNEMKEKNAEGLALKKVSPLLLFFEKSTEEKFQYKLGLIDDYKFSHQFSKMKKRCIARLNRKIGFCYH